jgi:predicted regulator of Ras-like GTPase activity (Roadblock/LC7/MglB family)
MGSKQELFERTLSRMNQDGNFEASVLSLKDGLPLASSPLSYEDQMTAAMVALLNDTANKLNRELSLPQVDEISIVGDGGNRLVCRYFAVNGNDILLTVLAQPDQTYRRSHKPAYKIINTPLVIETLSLLDLQRHRRK